MVFTSVIDVNSGIYFYPLTDPGGIEGWVGLDGWYT